MKCPSTGYSGGPATDSHRLPFSPQTTSPGTNPKCKLQVTTCSDKGLNLASNALNKYNKDVVNVIYVGLGKSV